MTQHVRGDAQLEPDAAVCDVDVGIVLVLVERADPLGRELEGRAHARVDLVSERIPALARQLVAARGRLALVEPARVVGDRGVATRANVSEDLRDLRVRLARHSRRAIEQSIRFHGSSEELL